MHTVMKDMKLQLLQHASISAYCSLEQEVLLSTGIRVKSSVLLHQCLLGLGVVESSSMEKGLGVLVDKLLMS